MSDKKVIHIETEIEENESILAKQSQATVLDLELIKKLLLGF